MFRNYKLIFSNETNDLKWNESNLISFCYLYNNKMFVFRILCISTLTNWKNNIIFIKDPINYIIGPCTEGNVLHKHCYWEN